MPSTASKAEVEWSEGGNGVALIGGIGFTMSLFIGTLAFPDPAFAAQIRIGVLSGSIVSAVVGYFLLKSLANEAVTRT